MGKQFWLFKIFAFSLIFLALSGCVAALPVLVPAVAIAPGAYHGTKLVRTVGSGEIEMKPFENTYFAPSGDLDNIRSAKVMATTPFYGYSLGQSTLPNEFISLLSAKSTIKTISPYKFSEQINSVAPFNSTEQDIAEYVKTSGVKCGADLIFLGGYIREGSGMSTTDILFGGKTKYQFRLVVRLASVKNGETLWKDELPFIVSIGTTNPPEKEIAKVLASQLMDRVERLPLPR